MRDAVQAIEEIGPVAKTISSELASLGLSGTLITRTITSDAGGIKRLRMIEVSRDDVFIARVFVKDLPGFLIGYAAAADTR